MKHAERRLRDYLADIVEAQLRIAEYVQAVDRDQFLISHFVQDAVARNFEVIGEASKHLLQRFPDFAVSHPELPLTSAYKLRNVVAHGYHEVDFEIVWDTIQQDLPALARVARACLESLPEG
jgi:uncharacterized protein with HEPN domain